MKNLIQLAMRSAYTPALTLILILAAWFAPAGRVDAPGETDSPGAEDAASEQRFFLPLVLKSDCSAQLILDDSFEGDFPGPWQVFDFSGSGWKWGSGVCRAAHGGRSAWMMGGGPYTPECAAFYPAYLDTWLVYGPFDLSQASGADVHFNLWQSTAGNDQVCWYASPDDAHYTGYCRKLSTNGWSEQVFDLANLPAGSLAGQAQVWLAFSFYSDAALAQAEGAYIDDVQLRAYFGSPGCRPSATVSPDSLPVATTRRR